MQAAVARHSDGARLAGDFWAEGCDDPARRLPTPRGTQPALEQRPDDEPFRASAKVLVWHGSDPKHRMWRHARLLRKRPDDGSKPTPVIDKRTGDVKYSGLEYEVVSAVPMLSGVSKQSRSRAHAFCPTTASPRHANSLLEGEFSPSQEFGTIQVCPACMQGCVQESWVQALLLAASRPRPHSNLEIEKCLWR